MQVSMYGRHSCASCSDGARGSARNEGKLQNAMARPPSFTTTFGDLASSRMLSRQIGKRSLSLPS